MIPVVVGGQAKAGRRAGFTGLEYGVGEGRKKSAAQRKSSDDRMESTRHRRSWSGWSSAQGVVVIC
jgi:hypothetical protein